MHLALTAVSVFSLAGGTLQDQTPIPQNNYPRLVLSICQAKAARAPDIAAPVHAGPKTDEDLCYLPRPDKNRDALQVQPPYEAKEKPLIKLKRLGVQVTVPFQ